MTVLRTLQLLLYCALVLNHSLQKPVIETNQDSIASTLLKMRCSITPLGSPTSTVIPLIFLITVNVGLSRGFMEHRIFNSVRT